MYKSMMKRKFVAGGWWLAGAMFSWALVPASGSAQVFMPATPPVSRTPVVDLEYDAQGNPTKTTSDKVTATNTAGLALTSSQHYNLLDQLDLLTDPKGNQTRLEYDKQGRLTKLTDPLGLVASYSVNGLGDNIGQSSPDTGSYSTFEVDSAGKPKFWVDAAGVNATLTYDAVGRLTNIGLTRGRPAENYSWTYDQTGPLYGSGIGRLTSTSTSTGLSTSYQYDYKGRLTGQTQTVPSLVSGASANLTRGATYTYSGSDRLTGIVYPSGRKISFVYGSGATQPGAINLLPVGSTVPVTVLDSISWQPFGPARSWNWGGSTAKPHVRVFDDSGRLTRYPLGLYTRDITYDGAGRISGYKHYVTASKAQVPSVDQTFMYDKNSQLTTINMNATGWVIDYDANGNRKSVTIGTSTRLYGTETVAGTSTPKSNRLKTLSNPVVNLAHLPTGQTTSDEGRALYSYYLTGRPSSIVLTGNSKKVDFQFDANGQRLRKYGSNLVAGAWVVDEASQIQFFYDPAGHLLGEYDKTGAALREYVWLGDMPVAMLLRGGRGGAETFVYYIHTDHLDTPRAVMDTSGFVRWRWFADPFGIAVPETNPSNLGVFVQNLRMPGQYADAETGLFYNRFRDYDPMIGRYTQSDPIGLQGGINTYAYVGGNPVSGIDPMGLAQCFYYISTGRMNCYSDLPDQEGFEGQFASGNNSIPGCKNNPTCIGQSGVGPIPTGTWYWNMNGVSGKPGGRVLVPVKVDASRTNIRSHSCDNPFGPSTAGPFCSEGCLTGSVSTINALNNFLGLEWSRGVSNTLRVGP